MVHPFTFYKNVDIKLVRTTCVWKNLLRVQRNVILSAL